MGELKVSTSNFKGYMIQKDVHLVEDWREPKESAATRDGFGTGILEAAKKQESVVVLCADLAESTRVDDFKNEFPDRYIEMGVAEQNMAAVASGFANYGKIPFMTSYAAFSPGRNFEQIRTTIAISELPVVICGMHAGLSVGPDGATHQALEDIGLMRMLPNMTVVVPADSEEAHKATLAAAKIGSPIYLRFSRAKSPTFTTKNSPFEIGKAEVLYKSENPQVALVATGAMVHQALLAADELEQSGVNTMVVNNHTIKPMDAATILGAAKECGAVVTIEEHQVAGGMGSAVAELLSEKLPTPLIRVGVKDKFGQSGESQELFEHYEVDVPSIVAAARAVLVQK